MSQNPSSPALSDDSVRGQAMPSLNWTFPLLLLAFGAAAWLVVASALGLMGSIKFHSPNFLADFAALTYGRVRAAATHAFLYGFCVPMATTFALWQFARMTRARLALPGLIAIGAGFWHLGVATGLCGIFQGDLSGFENFEMPGYAVPILFTGFVVLGLWGCLTFHQREHSELEMSSWFSLAGVFWFPWIFSTAALSLFVFPLRGIAQNVIAWWYSGNLMIVWMGLAGLGAWFGILKRVDSQRQRHLGLFLFWTLLLFGSWVGIPAAAPVPAWMPVLSRVFTVLLLIPTLTVGVWGFRGGFRALEGIGASFFKVSCAAFLVYGLTLSLGAFFHLERITQFTWFKPALDLLGSYGFFTLAIFGAIYTIFPVLVDSDWPFPRFVRAHFYLALAGLLLTVAPLSIGGILQGLEWRNPTVNVVDVAAHTLKFLRVSTVGELFMALGNLLLLMNLTGLLVGVVKRTTAAFISNTMAPDALEVKS